MSIRRASEQFLIPKTTLGDYLKVKKSNKTMNKSGAPIILNSEEEDKLVGGLLICAEWGFPLKCRDIQIMVKSFLNRQGKNSRGRFLINMPGI